MEIPYFENNRIWTFQILENTSSEIFNFLKFPKILDKHQKVFDGNFDKIFHANRQISMRAVQKHTFENYLKITGNPEF